MSEGEVPFRAGGVRPPAAAGGERVSSKNVIMARSVKCRLRKVIDSRRTTLWSESMRISRGLRQVNTPGWTGGSGHIAADGPAGTARDFGTIPIPRRTRGAEQGGRGPDRSRGLASVDDGARKDAHERSITQTQWVQRHQLARARENPAGRSALRFSSVNPLNHRSRTAFAVFSVSSNAPQGASRHTSERDGTVYALSRRHAAQRGPMPPRLRAPTGTRSTPVLGPTRGSPYSGTGSSII